MWKAGFKANVRMSAAVRLPRSKILGLICCSALLSFARALQPELGHRGQFSLDSLARFLFLSLFYPPNGSASSSPAANEQPIEQCLSSARN